MFTCKDAIDLLRGYVDGDMTAEARTHLEQHLGECSPCVDFLKTYQATPGLCRKALAAKMPEALATKLGEYLKANLKKV